MHCIIAFIVVFFTYFQFPLKCLIIHLLFLLPIYPNKEQICISTRLLADIYFVNPEWDLIFRPIAKRNLSYGLKKIITQLPESKSVVLKGSTFS